jgi:phage terminase small subunit
MEKQGKYLNNTTVATNLTKKQKGFVKDYIETGIGSLAVKKNYNVVTDETARAIATENLTKPLIVKAIQEALPDGLLAEKHLELLQAVTLSSFKFSKHDTDEDIRELVNSIPGHEIMYIRTNYDSNKIDIVDKTAYLKIPDSIAQDKALDKAYKLKGSYAAEKTTSLNVNVAVDNSNKTELEAMREEFEDKLRYQLQNGEVK